MIKKLLVLGLVAGFCFTVMAQEAPSVGLGVKVGTPGPGVEIGIPFTPNIGGRLGLNYFTYSYDTTQEGIKYDANLTLFSIAGLIDWHPTGGSFRVTGGLLYNGNELTGKAKIEEGGTIKIGDIEYTDTEVGTLKAKADFDDLSPYLGIGWDTSFGAEKQWGFICDLGVIYHNSPNIKLTSKGGTLSSDPDFLDELKKEQEELEDSIEDFKLYPVITLGLIYRF
ncbi:MAG: hypothetical protein NC932_01145 [Candidatus Omnitrophica bacterium]|nr:hypothetical protein [Candidatus Omnitrophota bacterium]